MGLFNNLATFLGVIASEAWQSHKREWIKGVIARNCGIPSLRSEQAWQSHVYDIAKSEATWQSVKDGCHCEEL